MRRLTVLAVLALGLAACGGSSANPLKITLGRSGGTLVPYSVTIAPGGAVSTTGNPPTTPKSLTRARDLELSREVRNGFAKLKSDSCARDFPDESAMFITALGKTVTVRGTCEPGFTTLWVALTGALGLPQ